MSTTNPAETSGAPRSRVASPGSTDPGYRSPAVIAAELDRARARTLALLERDEQTQRAQISPLMSPMVWDLAHIGNYEELWLLRALDDRGPVDAELDDLYNAFEHPRWERPSLPILGPAEARAYDERIRAEVLALLPRVDLAPTADPLTAEGFVYGMVIQHEHQHDETLVATLQLMGDRATPPPRTTPAPSAPRVDPASLPAVQLVPAGSTTVGTTDVPWAYDNELEAHEVDLAAFLIDTFPVTNRAYAGFVTDGGYDDERLWSPTGWAWRQEADLAHPQHWELDGEDGTSGSVLRFGRRLDLAAVADEPVQHVGFHEAEAYARWAGGRLPTEAEWERAAEGVPAPWTPSGGTTTAANLGQRHDGPAVVGAYPEGASRWGVHQLLGDVWEWTSSPFVPHPGFRAFPYWEYSEVFWGDEHRVLKGGSWAADGTAVRVGFRNWDYPIRRQIFSGFRCVRDA